MQRGGHHQGKAHAARFLAHHILGLEGIGDHVGKRPVVANRACQDKLHALFDAAIEDAPLHHPLLNGLVNAAGLSDRIDRSQMMLVTFAGANVFVQVDAQRRAKERAFDIVHRQTVAREQNLDEFIFDQLD